MALENTNFGGISVDSKFAPQMTFPLDSRSTVKNTNGLNELITANAAYDGMIVYVESNQKTYQAHLVTQENGDSGLVFAELSTGLSQEDVEELIATATLAKMEFKGVVANGQLPVSTQTTPLKTGYTYKVVTNIITIAAQNNAQENAQTIAQIGDTIVYHGKIDNSDKWYVIPSGDEQSISGDEVDNKINALKGNTTATVADCVQAINKMNNHVNEQNEAVSTALDTVENIAKQLTWGSF